VQLVLPTFNTIAGKQLVILWSTPWFWVIGIGSMLLTGIIAGSYPALYLSSFHAIAVLKGTFKMGRLASLPRKILVVIQFTVSIALVIATLMVYQQVQFTKNRPVGYDREGLVSIEMVSPDFYGKFDALQTELIAAGAITNMAESSSPLTAIYSNNGGFNWEGKDPDLHADFGTIWVSHNYGNTVGWHFKEGRDFSIDHASDSSALIINEAAVKFMGIINPVGKTMRWGSGADEDIFTIVGVVQDMVTQSPYAPVKQTVYLFNKENENFFNLRLNPEKPVSESLAIIEKVFKKMIPSAPFDYKFADDGYAAKFLNEERIGKLATFFTALAIFISLLGLFGLASFIAEQRTKEIGIRKIVGASIFNLWRLLSKDFVVLVSISCIIAMPLAYYFLDGWLKRYQYRTELSWQIFVVSGIGALVLTMLTVSYQTIKAALVNPVRSLRTE
jgi:putative ABC transport system permease protein